MARDYFSEITDDESSSRRARGRERSVETPAGGGERTIRNISVPSRRHSSLSGKMGGDIRSERTHEHASSGGGGAPRRSRIFVWGVAGVSVLALGGVVILMLWSDTTVTVTPRTHQVTFDASTQFTAYPEASASPGGITYTVKTDTFEDSATVPATGVEKAEDRASGTITVYNEYSVSPVRLIKNTRFETPSGLIFKIPASVEVPGLKGATPGQITVTVFADQPGPNYNVAPTERFTLPGLKSTADMFRNVYARSTETFSGGFMGDKPAVSAQALETARNEIRGRLAEKAKAAASSVSEGFAFADLVGISYESLPTTSDSGGARVNEKAVVRTIVFPGKVFAQAIARAVSADASESSVSLRPQNGFDAKRRGDIPANLGEAPIIFTLFGSATIVWDVDAGAIAEALAGREQSAFKPLVATFSGVEKAEATIAPFWSSTFPSNSSDITIKLVEPKP